MSNTKRIALCSSAKCTNITHVLNGCKFVEKKVSFGKTCCPDCGHVLLWKKKRTNTRVLDKKHVPNFYQPTTIFI